jgi:exonuclease SbcD
MKILHTADWHLGRSLGSIELLDLQRQALTEVVRIAEEERPDAIVIAGDLYDRSVPSEEAMRVFEKAMIALRRVAPVLAIAGNHDGAGRVAHFARVLRAAGIHLAATDFGAVPCVVLQDAHGPVHFHLMPFAMPAEVRHALRERVGAPNADAAAAAGAAGGADPNAASCTTHDAATAARIATIDRVPGARHVLVGHLFTQAGDDRQESDSERDISVGGSSVVRPSCFDGFQYVALGHLHKPHDVVPGRVRYAGSIGRFSFSEESHEKSVSIVELGADGRAAVRSVPIPQPIGMRTVRGPFEEVLRAMAAETVGREAFTRVVLTDAVPQFEAFRRLHAHAPHLLEVSYERSSEAAGAAPSLDRPERRDPMEMVREFCRDRLGDRPPSDAMLALAGELMEQARKEAVP